MWIPSHSISILSHLKSIAFPIRSLLRTSRIITVYSTQLLSPPAYYSTFLISKPRFLGKKNLVELSTFFPSYLITRKRVKSGENELLSRADGYLQVWTGANCEKRADFWFVDSSGTFQWRSLDFVFFSWWVDFKTVSFFHPRSAFLRFWSVWVLKSCFFFRFLQARKLSHLIGGCVFFFTFYFLGFPEIGWKTMTQENDFTVCSNFFPHLGFVVSSALVVSIRTGHVYGFIWLHAFQFLRMENIITYWEDWKCFVFIGRKKVGGVKNIRLAYHIGSILECDFLRFCF